MRAPRLPVLLTVLLLVPLLAGCTQPAADDAVVQVALPRYGDEATYRVEGAFFDFLRWNNGFPVSGESATVTFRVGEGGTHFDGFRDVHETYAVQYALNGQTLHERYVSLLRGAVVQGTTPLGGDNSAVSFDDRGYPWAFGASELFGEALGRGRDVAFELPGNAGQGPADTLGRGTPLLLAWRVLDVQDDVARVSLVGSENVTWTLWMREGSPYPERVEVAWNGTGLKPYVVTNEPGDLRMVATLQHVARGEDSIRPPDPGAPAWMASPQDADFRVWNGERPPDGDDAYVPFRLGDAVEHAKAADPGVRSWLDAHRDARLYRATYHESEGDLPGTHVRHWLMVWMSADDEYYEVQVDETAHPDLPPGVGGARVVEHSNPVDPPAGEHGWFPASALPDRLLTLSDGVRIMRELFHPDGVEIFLRSFSDPVGYAYYVDGGFETGKRYTVIVNAQTGFVQGAVGPVTPRTFDAESTTSQNPA